MFRRMDHVLKILGGIILAFFLAGCASTSFNTPNAKGYYASSPEQCVPYARQVSGIPLYGDAYTWWAQANPPLIRSQYPSPNAVLVLARTNAMRHGHVAVVKTILGTRDITVTHSNWGWNRKNRRIIYESVRAQDVSPANNWTQIRFWSYETGAFGRPYAAYGFISR